MMKFNRIRSLLLLAILVLGSGARILPPPQVVRIDHPLLFLKASNDEIDIYLYGSIHGMFKPEVGYPLPLRIMDIFDNSDQIFIMDTPENANELYDAVARTDATWEDSLGAQQASALLALLDALQLSDDQRQELLDYQPWILLNLLYQIFIYELGYNAQPEHEFFEHRAKEQKLNLEKVLTFPAEMEFIATLSEHHAKDLYEWLFNRFTFFQRGFNLAQTLQNAWLQGNVIAALDQLVLSRSPQLEAVRDAEIDLYGKINDLYWLAITNYLANQEAGTQLFVVLPADYLLDNGGFAQFLESQAFTVSRA